MFSIFTKNASRSASDIGLIEYHLRGVNDVERLETVNLTQQQVKPPCVVTGALITHEFWYKESQVLHLSFVAYRSNLILQHGQVNSSTDIMQKYKNFSKILKKNKKFKINELNKYNKK